MRVYKHSGKASAFPYLDNCYISYTKKDPSDVDSTSASSLYEFFRVGQIDYIQYRRFVREYVLPGWATATSQEKSLMGLHNIAPSVEELSLIYTEAERMDHFLDVVRLEVLARKLRWKEAMSKAAFRLLDNELGRLMMYNDAKVFRDDYVEADLPHLVLWLTDGTYPPLGIDFASSGFGSKPYYSEIIKNEALSVLMK